MPLSRKPPFYVFEYPVTKPFANRHHFLDWILLVCAIVAIAGLTALNAFLVGYESVSVFTVDFNQTEDQGLPWYMSWKEGRQTCQKHQFHLGDRFRTNSSAFSYEIFGLNANEGAESLYANSPLDGCDVENFQFVASLHDRLLSLDAAIHCPAPLNIQARTSWSYTNHYIIGSVSGTAFAENTVPRAIIDTMSYFGAMNYDKGIWTSAYKYRNDLLSKFVIVGHQHCKPEGNCLQARPDVGITFFNGIRNSDMGIVFDGAQSPDDLDLDLNLVYDLLQVFVAAVKLDIGRLDTTNLFINGTAFKESLNPDYVSASTDSSMSTFLANAQQRGAANVNITSETESQAIKPEPATIQLSYACNTRQRKSAGSFIASVASATISVFLAIWGLIITVLGDWARRHPRGNECGHDGEAQMKLRTVNDAGDIAVLRSSSFSRGRSDSMDSLIHTSK